MHAFSHSLAHRAPPATRTRVRWQPYSALPQSLPSRSPPVSYLNTPASSVPSSPLSASSLCEIDPPKHPLPQTPKSSQLRDSQKNKFVLGLVDQAVKSLCEIWPAQDIPSVFLLSSQASEAVALASDSILPIISQNSLGRLRNTQLPSPISPLTQRSPVSPPSIASRTTSLSSRPNKAQSTSSAQSRTNLVPIKGFVHEVLRRSRTSGSVLQTALCYLEAIRPKVPELVRREQIGDGIQGEAELADRIAQVEVDVNPCMAVDPVGSSDLYSEPHVAEKGNQHSSNTQARPIPQDSTKRPKVPSPPLPPLPPLPSPLLCPRRAFLASLILASKFTQDKCYSNRAWAKLSGLPPREIGRCERALGDALEWRLWVGKTPPTSPATSTSAPNGTVRTVVRSRSDSDLMAFSKSASSKRLHAESHTIGLSSTTSSTTRGILARSATLPPSGFAEQILPVSNSFKLGDLPLEAPSTGYETMTTSTAPMRTIIMNDPPTYTPVNTEQPCASPSNVATPTLSFSPSSTESSSGERTIHMTSFIDEPVGTSWPYGCFILANENSKVSPPIGDGFPCTTPYAPNNPAMLLGSEKVCVPHLVQPYAIDPAHMYSY